MYNLNTTNPVSLNILAKVLHHIVGLNETSLVA